MTKPVLASSGVLGFFRRAERGLPMPSSESLPAFSFGLSLICTIWLRVSTMCGYGGRCAAPTKNINSVWEDHEEDQLAGINCLSRVIPSCFQRGSFACSGDAGVPACDIALPLMNTKHGQTRHRCFRGPWRIVHLELLPPRLAMQAGLAASGACLLPAEMPAQQAPLLADLLLPQDAPRKLLPYATAPAQGQSLSPCIPSRRTSVFLSIPYTIIMHPLRTSRKFIFLHIHRCLPSPAEKDVSWFSRSWRR